MKVHVADRVDHADRAVAEQDGPAFQIKIAQGEKRGIRSGIGPARRGQQFGEGKQPIAEIGDVEYRIVYAEGGLNGGGVREKPEAWPDVQPFDGQQRAVGRSRLFKVGDTDAAHGNAEGKRVDRKGFDGDGALTASESWLSTTPRSTVGGRETARAVHRAQRRPIPKRQARQPLAERRPRVRAFSSSACAETGGSGGVFLTARRFLRRLRCLEAMRVSCVG